MSVRLSKMYFGCKNRGDKINKQGFYVKYFTLLINSQIKKYLCIWKR